MSDIKEDGTKKNSTADKELEDLLDSALEDMTAKEAKKINNNESQAITDGQIPADFKPEDLWSSEFMEEAVATCGSNLAALLGSLKGCSEESISPDQIAATFQMMAEAAAQVMKPGDSTADPNLENDEEAPKQLGDVTSAIAKALESLNVNADNLQNQNTLSDEDIKNMFAGLNFDGQDGADNMFVPFMKDMMQSLLSKEVLYPSLKEVVDKYPNWLSEKKGKIDSKDFDRYSKQYELMTKVCTELEKETESDSEEIKKARFELILELMQQMQELGQPPDELTPDLQQSPMLPQMDPNQCKPM